MEKMREGEEKDVKEEMKEEKTEAKDKKYTFAKKIVDHKGSGKKFLKEEECKICGKKHKTSEHHKHK